MTDHEGILTAAVAGQSRQICLVHIFPFCTPQSFSHLHLEANWDDLGRQNKTTLQSNAELTIKPLKTNTQVIQAALIS